MYSLSLLEQAGALSLSQKKGKKDKNDKKDKHDEINMTNNGGSNTTSTSVDTAPDNPDQKKGKKDKKDKKDKHDKKKKKKKAKKQVQDYFNLLAYLLVVGVLGKVPIISTPADNPTTPTELASDIPALRAAAPTLIEWVEQTLTLDTTNLSLGEGAILGTGAADGVYFHRSIGPQHYPLIAWIV